MGARDYAQAGSLIAPEAEVRWPLSQELLTRDNWVTVNEAYPGVWTASVDEIVGHGNQIVSAVHVYQSGESDPGFYVTSFFTIQDSLIVRLIEYWSHIDLSAPEVSARLNAALTTRQ